MPVYLDVLADMETPLSAYWKLAHDQTFSFLLESVTGGEQLARYSLLGVRPRKVLRAKGRTVRVWTEEGETIRDLPEGIDPLAALEAEMAAEPPIQVPGMPAFVGGAVGMMGYDLVRFFEKLPDTCEDDLGTDDLAMMLTRCVVVFDHARNLIRIIAMANGTAAGYEEACREIEWVRERLALPRPPLPEGKGEYHPPTCNMTQAEYEAAVETIRDYIVAGDGIQMVPSLRFSAPVSAPPIAIYRALRSLNPSPYMFLLRFGAFDLVGASPELHVSLHGREARVRPIAGTRPRGESETEDRALAEDLLADAKERAEHIMLVDLGRNDLGRVCEYGSVRVEELMVIERYSHVMHIVSDVRGALPPSQSVFDLIRASFPAGTVSGAPKVRAMEIIDEVEKTRRGSYAGAIGFLSDSGDLDTCIAIRTIYLQNGRAHVQAGAGVVSDSVPSKEYEECRNKARACLEALRLAHEGLEG